MIPFRVYSIMFNEWDDLVTNRYLFRRVLFVLNIIEQFRIDNRSRLSWVRSRVAAGVQTLTPPRVALSSRLSWDRSRAGCWIWPYRPPRRVTRSSRSPRRRPPATGTMCSSDRPAPALSPTWSVRRRLFSLVSCCLLMCIFFVSSSSLLFVFEVSYSCHINTSFGSWSCFCLS